MTEDYLINTYVKRGWKLRDNMAGQDGGVSIHTTSGFVLPAIVLLLLVFLAAGLFLYMRWPSSHNYHEVAASKTNSKTELEQVMLYSYDWFNTPDAKVVHQESSILGKLIGDYHLCQQAPCQLATSPDGTSLFVLTNDGARLYSAADLNQPRISIASPKLSDQTSSFKWSNDSRGVYLVINKNEKNLLYYLDAAKGGLSQVMNLDDGALFSQVIESANVSSNTFCVLSGSNAYGRNYEIFDTSTKQITHQINNFTQLAMERDTIVFSPDCRFAYYLDGNSLLQHDMVQNTKKGLAAIMLPVSSKFGFIGKSLSLVPTTQILMYSEIDPTGSTQTYFYDLAHMTVVKKLVNSPISHFENISWNSDGQYAFLGGLTTGYYLFDRSTMTTSQPLQSPTNTLIGFVGWLNAAN